MTRQTGITLLLMVVAFFIGFWTQSIWISFGTMQQKSIAGQTLADLSRAIETERVNNGAYPDSIEGLKVLSAGGDFSKELLREVTYFKTEKGFVAFVGVPQVAYTDSGKYFHFN